MKRHLLWIGLSLAVIGCGGSSNSLEPVASDPYASFGLEDRFYIGTLTESVNGAGFVSKPYVITASPGDSRIQGYVQQPPTTWISFSVAANTSTYQSEPIRFDFQRRDDQHLLYGRTNGGMRLTGTASLDRPNWAPAPVLNAGGYDGFVYARNIETGKLAMVATVYGRVSNTGEFWFRYDDGYGEAASNSALGSAMIVVGKLIGDGQLEDDPSKVRAFGDESNFTLTDVSWIPSVYQVFYRLKRTGD